MKLFKVKHSPVILVCVLLQLMGTAIFLKGFFPIKAAVPGHATDKDMPIEPGIQMKNEGSKSEPLKPIFGRMVFILIDALRADFVLPTINSKLPRLKYVSQLINNRDTYSFLAKAHPPTVTMPRIKALTSGGIPGFADVVLNFYSKAFIEDNLVTQFYKSGKKLVFYGDDTWMKLFPGHFIRTDGTTSFFVTDYTEVDNNVTRHIDDELSRSDWDVLILHYLGLDHIGHLAGPYSPLVNPKLSEMDGIIQHIHTFTAAQDQTNSLPTLIVLCGDHGMSDQGSHGGASSSETTTPVVLISSLYDGGKGVAYQAKTVQQIDVVPTLAVLMGVPIPQNNLGTAIPSVLNSMTERERLRALQANAYQLLKVLQQNVPEWDREPGYLQLQRATDLHAAWLQRHLEGSMHTSHTQLCETVMELYSKAMHTMTDRVSKALATYDIHAMSVGIAILWLVLLCLVFVYCSGELEAPAIVFTVSPFVCIGTCGLLIMAHLMVCTSPHASDVLCSTQLISVILMVLLVPMATIVIVMCLAFAVRLPSLIIQKAWQWVSPGAESYRSLVVVIGTTLLACSLLSSSFVEEEHQTWYFVTVTVFLLLLLAAVIHIIIHWQVPDETATLRSQTKQKENTTSKFDERNTDKHVDTDMQISEAASDAQEITTRLCCGMKRSSSSVIGSYNLVSNKLTSQQLARKVAAMTTVALVMCRALRAWNQTGDKWSHLPDIGDWLVRPENKDSFSVTVVTSLLCVCTLRYHFHSTLFRVLMPIGAMAVYCFRTATGVLALPYFYQHSITKGITEARIVYLIILIMFLHIIYSYFKYHKCSEDASQSHLSQMFEDVISMWTLLMLLLLRPHNIPLVALMTVQHICVSWCTQRLFFLPTSVLTLIYYWIAQAAWFYQGNSNSIATVDVSAGYIGLQDYSEPIIGLLMCIATYAAPILWMISLLSVTVSKTHQDSSGAREYSARLQSAGRSVGCVLALCRGVPLAIYTVLVSMLRHHLFVWTVFSPKLLYEGMWLVIMSCIIVLTMVLLR